MNLQNWVNQAREHWKEFQPKRYAALKRAGKLEAALQDAAERTYRETKDLEDCGVTTQDAWEMVRERYLFPPEEGKKPAQDSPGWSPQSADWSSVLRDAIKSSARTVNVPDASFTLADLKKALKGE